MILCVLIVKYCYYFIYVLCYLDLYMTVLHSWKIVFFSDMLYIVTSRIYRIKLSCIQNWFQMILRHVTFQKITKFPSWFLSACAHNIHQADKSFQTENKKITINWPFFIFLAVIELSENCLLVTCTTHFSRINEKLFMLSRPQGQTIDLKCEKS